MRNRVSQDVWVLIGLLVLLLAAGLVAGKQQRNGAGIEVIPRRTTYSSRPGGVKALYETLDKLGYSPKRHIQEMTTVPQDGVLFIIDPESPVSDSEWRSIRGWVERGNLLVLASGVPAWNVDADKEKPSKSTATCPSFLAPDVKYYDTAELNRIEADEWSFRHCDDFARPSG